MGDTTNNLFIGLSGIIGAGKTTLASALGEAMGLPMYPEPVEDQEYLEDFYKDMKKHSFAMQIYLLRRRFAQHMQIIWRGQGGVQDRTIYEDSIFAEMLMKSGMMEERDYRTYIDLFALMSNMMRHPTVIVYLDVTPETALERVRTRNRPCEKNITVEYLAALKAAYEEFIARISQKIPVIRVDWNDFCDPGETARCILEEYRNIRGVHTISPKKKSDT